MSYLLPNHRSLQQSFGSPPQPTSEAPRSRSQQPSKATPYQARSDLYTAAYSVVDDAKNKAQKLSAEAQHEFDKASGAAQAKAGKIELYTPKYYAACTFGGLLACVSKCPAIRFPSNGRKGRSERLYAPKLYN